MGKVPGEDPTAPRRVGGYRLLRLIGSGGMGSVYHAELDGGGAQRPVAVKLLKNVDTDASARRAFAREARLSSLLAHPNVVRTLDSGVDDDVHWIAMELVAGLTFYDVIRGGTLVEQLPPDATTTTARTPRPDPPARRATVPVAEPPESAGRMCTKLHGLLGATRWIEVTYGADALRRVLAACSDGVRQRHATGIGINWHPVAEFVALLGVVEEQLGDGSGSTAQTIGAALARTNTRGALLRQPEFAVRPSFLMERVASLWRQFNDQGAMRVVEIDRHALTIEVEGVGDPAWLHCCTITGWARALLEEVGAREPVVQHGTCRARSGARCVWDVRWASLAREPP